MTGVQTCALPISNEDIYADITKGLAEFADGEHTIEISARIGTGEKPVVYTGKLV